jgi:hypothetical protein
LPILIEIEVSRPSVTLRKHQQLEAFKRETLHRDTSLLPGEIEVSRPSVTLRQTVTLHRDTSIPLGGIEVSRQVWTSATLTLQAHCVTALTARLAATEALTYDRQDKPSGAPLAPRTASAMYKHRADLRVVGSSQMPSRWFWLSCACPWRQRLPTQRTMRHYRGH